MVMRNWKKEALEFLAQIMLTNTAIWTLFWMFIKWG